MARSIQAFSCLILPMGLLLGCGSSGGSSGSAPIDLPDLPLINTDSAAMTSVKDGRVKACPIKTLEEMADDFFGSPSWYEFESTTGKTVIEVSGTLSYRGLPADATIQFVVDALGGFEATYLEVDGEAQSLLVLAGLFDKMCAA